MVKRFDKESHLEPPEMETQSSEEEDDHHYLINETSVPINYQSPASFQIENMTNTKSANKCLLFSISLPLIIIILLFLLFRTNSPPHAPINQTRAINLLKHQQFTLLQLFNHTSLHNNSTTMLINSDSNYSLPDLKSDLLHQISLNKQIQQMFLLSNEIDFNDNVDGSFRNRCSKVDQRLSEKGKIEWKPKENKFLFAICTSGQMSNHLICLEKHMFFAALLSRVLVIPSSKVDYDFQRVVDVEHISKCLGRKVVVTFEEFAESRKNHLSIDKFICYFSLPQPCFVDDDHVKKLKALGVSMSKVESAWVEDVKKPTPRTMKDVMAKFSSNEDVIAIGDVFFADVEKEWVMQPGGPISHQCKTLIEPSHLILLTAQQFVQTFLGENFVALHFRRHGFLKFCNVKTPSCFYPVPQAAECITRIVERANAPVIYLSTDAAESETELLQSLVVFNLKIVPLVKRPARNSAEKWDALLYRNHIEGDAQVEAMLDKTICALSSVFIGSSGSTFTEDILRLRKDWSSASVCDEYLCQGELPNFVAEDENAH